MGKRGETIIITEHKLFRIKPMKKETGTGTPCVNPCYPRRCGGRSPLLRFKIKTQGESHHEIWRALVPTLFDILIANVTVRKLLQRTWSSFFAVFSDQAPSVY